MSELPMDLLRTLAVSRDAGSLARAARLVGRTPSAVSLQMRRLEEQAGRALFRKQGRTVALTEAGEVLLGYARRILQLNDECLAAVRDRALAGAVRVGVPQDLAEGAFPVALARFARAHPAVRVEARVERSGALVAALEQGALDLALLLSREGRERAQHLAWLPLAWIASPRFQLPARGQPLPLVLFDPPCQFRSAALAALDAAGLPWTVSFSSPSLSGLWAAVEAGLGVTVRTSLGLPRRLRVLRARGLPALPATGLWLDSAAAQPGLAAQGLRQILLEVLVPRIARQARRAV